MRSSLALGDHALRIGSNMLKPAGAELAAINFAYGYLAMISFHDL